MLRRRLLQQLQGKLEIGFGVGIPRTALQRLTVGLDGGTEVLHLKLCVALVVKALCCQAGILSYRDPVEFLQGPLVVAELVERVPHIQMQGR